MSFLDLRGGRGVGGQGAGRQRQQQSLPLAEQRLHRAAGHLQGAELGVERGKPPAKALLAKPQCGHPRSQLELGQQRLPTRILAADPGRGQPAQK